VHFFTENRTKGVDKVLAEQYIYDGMRKRIKGPEFCLPPQNSTGGAKPNGQSLRPLTTLSHIAPPKILRCRYCGVAKPISEFYVSNKSKCRDCVLKHNADWRRKNRERMREKYRQWYAKNGRNDRGKAYYERYIKPYSEKHPEATKARRILRYAIKKGEIQKGQNCSICGKKTQSLVGHHENYTQPLIVEWVCYSCHRKIHDPKASFTESLL